MKEHMHRLYVKPFETIMVMVVFTLIVASHSSNAEEVTGIAVKSKLEQLEADTRRIAYDGSDVCIDAIVIREDFPRTSPDMVQESIRRSREKIKEEYASKPELAEMLAAAAYNVEWNINNHVIERSHLKLIALKGKWRLDDELLERTESVTLPEALTRNPYVESFPTEPNRFRTYTWDKQLQRIIFHTRDQYSRLGNIYGTEQRLGFVDALMELGQVPTDIYKYLLSNSVVVKSREVSPDELDFFAADHAGRWSAQIVIRPSMGNTVTHLEMTKPGVSYSADYGEYKERDGVWYPFRAEERWYRIDGAELIPLKNQQWEVVGADFDAKVDDPKATFSPTMPDDATIVDYRFTPPLTYRTDDGLQLAEREVKALQFTGTMPEATGGARSIPPNGSSGAPGAALVDQRTRGPNFHRLVVGLVGLVACIAAACLAVVWKLRNRGEDLETTKI